MSFSSGNRDTDEPSNPDQPRTKVTARTFGSLANFATLPERRHINGPSVKNARDLNDVSDLSRDPSPSWKVWVGPVLTDAGTFGGNAEMSNENWNLAVGIGNRINDESMIGIATSLRRNETAWPNSTHTNWDATFVGPYFAHRFSRHAVFDVWAGVSSGAGASRAANLGGEYDSTGYFLATSMTVLFEVGVVQVRPRMSLLYNDREFDGYRLASDPGSTADYVAVRGHDLTSGIGRLSAETSRVFDIPDQTHIATFLRAGISYEAGNAVDENFMMNALSETNQSRWRGDTQLGIRIDLFGKAAVEIEGGYDGIGDNESDVWSLRGALTIGL
jgi:outer membrane autotransporter protein